jgi:hypothetical protein
MTARQLIDWAWTNIQNMFEFVTKLEFIDEEKFLYKRNSGT